jgi:hypothetical protein
MTHQWHVQVALHSCFAYAMRRQSPGGWRLYTAVSQLWRTVTCAQSGLQA